MKQIDSTQNQFKNSELEQIEEMAKVIKSSMDNLGCGNFNFTGDEISTMFAKVLYNAGYRKQSDVAREIFEEIDRFIYKVLNDEHYIMGDMCWDVAELKKKYTEGENDRA